MGRYLGRRPFAADLLRAEPNFAAKACLDDFAANGSCIRPKGHAGFHQDAHGHAWRPVEPICPHLTVAACDCAGRKEVG